MVNRSKALLLRLFDVGQNLIVLRAECLREWSCKGLYRSHMRLVSHPPGSSSKGAYHVGEGLNHTTSNILGEEGSGRIHTTP